MAWATSVKLMKRPNKKASPRFFEVESPLRGLMVTESSLEVEKEESVVTSRSLPSEYVAFTVNGVSRSSPLSTTWAGSMVMPVGLGISPLSYSAPDSIHATSV